MASIVRMFFAAWKLIVLSFILLAALVLVGVALKPDKFEAHMSFLVRNDRAEPLVSSDKNQNSIQLGDVTEEQINSEVELLGSTELLQGVARACGLDQEYAGAGQGVGVEKATRKLGKALTITPVRKSSLINVAYSSKDRSQSVRVLNELAREYLQKHLTLHTADTAATFFREKSLEIQQQLQAAEERRVASLQSTGYALLPTQEQMTVQQLLDVRKAKDDADANIAETESRLASVAALAGRQPPRILTQERSSANQYSVERLNTLLAELQNRRTELATKFLPGDRLIVQADQQIADTKAALAAAEQLHSEDRTTDVNPLRQSLDAESDRLRQMRAGLVSRRSALNLQLVRHRSEIGRMEQAGIPLDDQDREIKELTETLSLYRSKAIAAGIADDLDAAKISNVMVAEPPIVPALPAQSPFNLMNGLLFAAFASLAIGFLSQLSDRPSAPRYAEDVEI